MIPYGKHSLSQDEIEVVKDVLENGWLTQGPKVGEFEQAITEFVGCPYSCAVTNATSALHLSYLALGANSQTVVWVPANTFVASSNAAAMCGSKIEFIDIDLKTGSTTPELLKLKLNESKASNTLPDIVCIVHFAGHPVNMKEVQKLAEEYKFRVIEDASHAIGSTYTCGSYVGSCKYSDLTVFSFHPVKIITTGEGGMITGKSQALVDRCRVLRSHGIDRDLHSRGDSWEFDQTLLGYNYRMTDIQAALGLVQTSKISSFVLKRNAIADRYISEINRDLIDLILPIENAVSSYHLFPIIVERRKEVFCTLRKKGIGVSVHYRPVYLNTYYRSMGFREGSCPNAESFYAGEISLPIFPDLTYDEQSYIINELNRACITRF